MIVSIDDVPNRADWTPPSALVSLKEQWPELVGLPCTPIAIKDDGALVVNVAPMSHSYFYNWQRPLLGILERAGFAFRSIRFEEAALVGGRQS